jgi:hypothetical protein
MAEIMDETGFEAGGKLTREIVAEMQQVIQIQEQTNRVETPEMVEEHKQKKKVWEKKIYELSASQPLSLLNRTKGTLNTLG